MPLSWSYFLILCDLCGLVGIVCVYVSYLIFRCLTWILFLSLVNDILFLCKFQPKHTQKNKEQSIVSTTRISSFVRICGVLHSHARKAYILGDNKIFLKIIIKNSGTTTEEANRKKQSETYRPKSQFIAQIYPIHLWLFLGMFFFMERRKKQLRGASHQPRKLCLR